MGRLVPEPLHWVNMSTSESESDPFALVANLALALCKDEGAFELVCEPLPGFLRSVLSQRLPDLAMVVLYGDLVFHNVIPTRCDIALAPVLPAPHRRGV